MPVPLYLHEVPQLLTVAHELEDVEDLASKVVLPRFDHLALILFSTCLLSFDQNAFVPSLLGLSLFQCLHVQFALGLLIEFPSLVVSCLVLLLQSGDLAVENLFASLFGLIHP